LTFYLIPVATGRKCQGGPKQTARVNTSIPSHRYILPQLCLFKDSKIGCLSHKKIKYLSRNIQKVIVTSVLTSPIRLHDIG